MSTHPDPGQARDIVAAVDRTPYGAVLHDPARRRQMVFEAMSISPDPMMREIGTQLLTGSAQPRDLLRGPHYREFFEQALAAGQRLDVGKLLADAKSVESDDLLTGDLVTDIGRADTAKAETGDGPAAKDKGRQAGR